MDVDVLIRLRSEGVDTSEPRWAGDLVAYKVRPHKGWGKAEGPPTYGIVTVTDVGSLSAITSRLVRHHRELELDGKTMKFRVRASHWINLDLLPAAQKQQLVSTGALPMPSTEFYSRTNDRVESLRSL